MIKDYLGNGEGAEKGRREGWEEEEMWKTFPTKILYGDGGRVNFVFSCEATL